MHDEYEIYAAEDGSVAIRRGTDLRLMPSRHARSIALRLSVGADIATDQKRQVDPRRYELPGEPIEPELAYWLVWQIVAVACELDMISEEDTVTLAFAH